MTAAEIILALVTAQRGAELLLSRHNSTRLMARGAVELGHGHYPLMVAVHAAWLVTLWAFGRDLPPDWILLAIYLALQGLRIWVMATLGARWTTRIIVLPGVPLVTQGPYRYLSHPNYVVVTCEIALLPLVLHLPLTAIVFTILNGIVLFFRLRAENRGLAKLREAGEEGAS